MSGRQFLLVLLVAASAAFAGGTFAVRLLPPAASQKTVSAREYHLLDSEGVKRASFVVSITEEPSLILRDREGKRRTVISFTESGEALWSEVTPTQDSTHFLAHNGRLPIPNCE